MQNPTNIVDIEHLSPSGQGVGYLQIDSKKIPVYIPYTCPQDQVKFEIINQEPFLIEGTLIEILKPSPFRTTPLCSHFGICGGCDWQHIEYDEQLKQKSLTLKHLLKKLDYQEDFTSIPSVDPFDYRARAKFKIINKHYGYSKKQSHEIVPITECRLLRKNLQHVLEKTLGTKSKEQAVAWDFKNNKTIFDDAKGYYFYNDLELAFRADSFIQANQATNIKLIDILLENLVGEKILELYAGNGNLTIPMAKKVQNITALEGDENSFKMLKENLTANKVENAEPVHINVRHFIQKAEAKKWDTIVMDPPRTGLGKLTANIANLTDNIVYISCNPKALVSDLKLLTKEGFKIKKCYLIDMFPQTRHFETVVFLGKI